VTKGIEIAAQAGAGRQNGAAALLQRQRAFAHGFSLLFFVIWAAYAAQLPVYVLPGPIQVAMRFGEFLTTPSLAVHAWISLLHVVASIAASFAVGLAMALLAYYVPVLYFAVHHRISPAFNAFPGIGWIMFAVLWFGINHLTVIFSISVVLLPFVLVNMREALDNLSADDLEMACSFTRNGWAAI
jgi:NitT/TauT family transport system permease protein